jgi:hypothetical protein
VLTNKIADHWKSQDKVTVNELGYQEALNTSEKRKFISILEEVISTLIYRECTYTYFLLGCDCHDKGPEEIQLHTTNEVININTKATHHN